jgi:hypothetical protein
VKTVWFDELPPYPIRSFTYRNEQVRADKVQRVIVYNMNVVCFFKDKVWDCNIDTIHILLQIITAILCLFSFLLPYMANVYLLINWYVFIYVESFN